MVVVERLNIPKIIKKAIKPIPKTTVRIKLHFDPYPLPSKAIDTMSDPESKLFRIFCLMDLRVPIFC